MCDITPDQMKKLVKDIATEFPISEFTILDKPKSFLKLFAGEDIPCVRVYQLFYLGPEDRALVLKSKGTFSWYNNLLSNGFTPEIKVYAYKLGKTHPGKKMQSKTSLEIMVNHWDWSLASLMNAERKTAM